MVSQFMDHSAADFFFHRLDSVAGPKDRAAVDDNAVWQAGVRSSPLQQWYALVNAEQFVALGIEAEFVQLRLVRLLFNHNRDVLERVVELFREALDCIADDCLKVCAVHGWTTSSSLL